jgi:hypothetical protein
MDEFQERRGPGRPPNPRPAEQQPQEQARPRPARKPFGALDQKLAYPDRLGYHRHWFNDVAGRVARAQEGGYEHVKDREGKNVTRIVGTAEGGGALNAFLMEIPEEWYQEDMAAQQSEIDAKEAIIKRGNFESKEGDGRYVPAQGISIKHGS